MFGDFLSALCSLKQLVKMNSEQGQDSKRWGLRWWTQRILASRNKRQKSADAVFYSLTRSLDFLLVFSLRGSVSWALTAQRNASSCFPTPDLNHMTFDMLRLILTRPLQTVCKSHCGEVSVDVLITFTPCFCCLDSAEHIKQSLMLPV